MDTIFGMLSPVRVANLHPVLFRLILIIGLFFARLGNAVEFFFELGEREAPQFCVFGCRAC
jgi:hypothetical protein